MGEQISPQGLKFRGVENDCATLFDKKNKEYGNSIEATGVLGATIELIGAVARLPILILRNPTHGRDKFSAIRNVFMDIVNYGIIALMMLNETMPDGTPGNWEGRTPWTDN